MECEYSRRERTRRTDVHLLWSLAETGYSFAAIAAMAVAWSIWRRAEPRRERTLLCGSILALVPFYGAMLPMLPSMRAVCPRSRSLSGARSGTPPS